MEPVTVTCNASGYQFEITDEILNKYRELGMNTPEDFGERIEDVTWVNGDYQHHFDSEWDENLPYWESAPL